MLPEVGATELLVIAVIALIVVGPKDLPVMLRKLGQFVARMRAMAGEFRASFEDMARQSELDELRREVEAMRSARHFDPVQLTGVDTEAFSDIHEGLTAPVSPEVEVVEAPPKPKRKPRAKKTPETEA